MESLKRLDIIFQDLSPFIVNQPGLLIIKSKELVICYLCFKNKLGYTLRIKHGYLRLH